MRGPVERQELQFLQLNFGRGKDDRDLMMQTARERGADMFLIIKQHKWSEMVTMRLLTRRKTLGLDNPDRVK